MSMNGACLGFRILFVFPNDWPGETSLLDKIWILLGTLIILVLEASGSGFLGKPRTEGFS